MNLAEKARALSTDNQMNEDIRGDMMFENGFSSRIAPGIPIIASPRVAS